MNTRHPHRSNRRPAAWPPATHALLEALEARMLYSTTIVHRINVGGEAVADVAGIWAADSAANPSPLGNGPAAGNKTVTVGGNIAGVPTGVPVEVFRSNRWDPGNQPELRYDLPVSNGDYQVRLYFAETWIGGFSNGARVFDVAVEDATALSNLDVYSEVGANTALVKTFDTNVTDGVLSVQLNHVVENPNLQAIEVVTEDTDPPVDPPAGPALYRLNIGGGELTLNGDVWAEDSATSPSPLGNAPATGNRVSGTGGPIAGVPDGVPQALYQSNRWDGGGTPELQYAFAVANGDYEVRVHLAETWVGGVPGVRVFDVNAEGATLIDDIDINTEAGGFNTALVRTATASVSDGVLNLEFIHQSQNPAVSGIEIYSLASGNSLAVSSSTVDFGTVDPGATASRTVTVSNPGVAGDPAITLSAATLGGADAARYTVDTPVAGVVLNPGQSLAVGLTYLPDTAGTNDDATLSFTHSGINSPVVVALDGEATNATGTAGVALYRLNVGGGQLVFEGNTWDADSAASPSPLGNGPATGNRTGGTGFPIAGVPAGVPAALYQSNRFDSAGGPELAYALPLSNGSYEVRVHFAENWIGGAPGVRVFDVNAEGETLFDDVDINAEAGDFNAALVRAGVATVSDGVLNLEFIHQTQNPAVNGIEVYALGEPNVLTVSSANLDFGTAQVGGAGATRSLTFTNAGGVGDPVIALGNAVLAGADAAAFSYTARRTDGSPVSLPGLGLNPGTSVIVDLTFAPTAAAPAAASFTLGHSGEVGTLTVDLAGLGSATAVNQPPVLAPVTAAITAREGEATTVALTATDPDAGQNLVFSATGLPAFASIVNTGPGTADLVITPDPGDAGDYGPFSITVTDNGVPALSDTQSGLTFGVLPAVIGGVIYRVNVGGPAVATQSGGPDWQTDIPDSGYSNADAAVSRRSSTGAPIDLSDPSVPVGTPEAVFQTERFDLAPGTEAEWDFSVTPGLYEVRLYFAEFAVGITGPGQRTFDVAIEGVQVLTDYDTVAEVGRFAGQVKSFIVNADGNLDVDFDRVLDNPALKGIEIIDANAANTLGAQLTTLDFGLVPQQDTTTRTATVYNLGNPGDPSITLTGATTSRTDFSIDPADVNGVVLAPGDSHTFEIDLDPESNGPLAGTLSLTHSGDASPLVFNLESVVVPGSTIAFGRSVAVNVGDPTSFQFGPDGRLYVGRRNAVIDVFEVVRNGPNDYASTLSEQITLIQQIDNHNDQGELQPLVDGRLLTGIFVAGTTTDPVIYATSSDPRTGGGDVFQETGIDTNSGMISRLDRSGGTGGTWSRTDLVRGMPRSDEFHSTSGLQLDAATNTLYVGVGGNTNAGAPSNNFGFLPEYALSAAIVSVDLDVIEALPTRTDPVSGTSYKYDLPTLDDEDRDFDGSGSDVNLATGVQDVFGGNNGKNQARLVDGGPVQVYASGFRNPYDLVITEDGSIYSTDNGPNGGWGSPPIINDNGTPGDPSDDYATNAISEGGVSLNDNVHRVTPGFYGGHPNPARASLNVTFNPTDPQAAVDTANPQESFYIQPGQGDGALALFEFSTNGIAEYTSDAFGGAMRGDLLAASHDGTVQRIKLSADGNSAELVQPLFSNVGVVPLDLTVMSDNDPFPGTVWVGDLVTNQIFVFEPETGGGDTSDPNGDADGDGYTNFDEASNGTSPTSSGDVPPDFDADYTSDLLDNDDDNDTTPDVSDAFAIDADNGTTTPIGTFLDFESGVQGGLLGLGFTGIMNNGNVDYRTQFNPNGITAGAAAGVLTIDQANAGTARGAANTQEQAFQIGVDVAGQTTPYTATTRMLAPFNNGPAQPGQEMGFFIGTGDQDNYLQLVLTGDGTASGGRVELGREVAGDFTQPAGTAATLGSFTGVVWVDLYLRVDPVAQTVQASYRVNDGATLGPRVGLGAPVSIAGLGWLDQPLAIGVISTSSVVVNDPADYLSATWNHLGVRYDAPGVLAADVADGAVLATPPGTALTRTVTLSNRGLPDAGAPAVTVTSAALGGPAAAAFAQAFAGPVALAAGESISFDVTFTATTLGDAPATLTLTHDGVGGSTALALTGRGVPDTASATLSLQTAGGNLQTASTSSAGGITLTNTSTTGQQIERVVIDLSTGFIADMVFDPEGFGGDTTAKDFTPDSGHLEAGLAYWAFEGRRGGGYDRLVLAFDDFNPGETVTFSVDIDPNSIKGVAAPGPAITGAVSGLELAGATVEIDFDEGSKTVGRVAPAAGSDIAGVANVSNQPVPGAPTVTLVGLGPSPVTTASANPTVRVTGTAGQTARVWVIEAGLFLDGVPGGGFSVDAFENNSAVAVRETTALIGPGGTADVAVLLTESGPEAGDHYVFAVLEDGGVASDPSDAVFVRFTP